MTLSLSLSVRSFFRPSLFFLLVSLKFVVHCFKKVSRVFQGSFEGVSRKFPGSFKEVSRVLQGSFKGVSRKFQGCFKEVSRTFHVSFKGV